LGIVQVFPTTKQRRKPLLKTSAKNDAPLMEAYIAVHAHLFKFPVGSATRTELQLPTIVSKNS